jgi:hypothetical protein
VTKSDRWRERKLNRLQDLPTAREGGGCVQLGAFGLALRVVRIIEGAG